MTIVGRNVCVVWPERTRERAEIVPSVPVAGVLRGIRRTMRSERQQMRERISRLRSTHASKPGYLRAALSLADQRCNAVSPDGIEMSNYKAPNQIYHVTGMGRRAQITSPANYHTGLLVTE